MIKIMVNIKETVEKVSVNIKMKKGKRPITEEEQALAVMIYTAILDSIVENINLEAEEEEAPGGEEQC